MLLVLKAGDGNIRHLLLLWPAESHEKSQACVVRGNRRRQGSCWIVTCTTHVCCPDCVCCKCVCVVYGDRAHIEL